VLAPAKLVGVAQTARAREWLVIIAPVMANYQASPLPEATRSEPR
jgi:hypothetical protein